jgi:parallel beta-helix repeat protein
MAKFCKWKANTILHNYVIPESSDISPVLNSLEILNYDIGNIEITQPTFSVSGSPLPSVYAYLGSTGSIQITNSTVSKYFKKEDVSEAGCIFSDLSDSCSYTIYVVAINSAGYSVQSIAQEIEEATPTYYIDFNSGSDSNNGTSELTPWKHCPGDTNATGIADSTILTAGDIVSFKGSINYRGTILASTSGTSTGYIQYRGDLWGDDAAIIDGSELLTDWTLCTSAGDCNGSIYWENIYYSYIPSDNYIHHRAANLHEEDSFLWLAMTPILPDPFFWSNTSGYWSLPTGVMTSTSLVDTNNLTQTDSNYWDGASLALWVSPNIVEVRDIASFNPDTDTLTWTTPVTPYTDRTTYYCILNSINSLTSSGMYCVNQTAEEDGSHKVFLWPRNISNLTTNITYSARTYGVDLIGNTIKIQGFTIEKFSGSATGTGFGVGNYQRAGFAKNNFSIRNNTFRHNCHINSGYGGIYLSYCNTALIENNIYFENMKHSGFYTTGSENIIFRNNVIQRPGGTAVVFFNTTNSQIVRNTVQDSISAHANGITTYLGCNNILIGWNKIFNCTNSITYQSSQNLYYYRNFIDSNENTYSVNDWGIWSGDEGSVYFINNTFVNASLSLSIGQVAQIPTYVINNITNGATGNPIGDIYHSYNIYTELSYSQSPTYGWFLGDGEATITNLDLIFSDYTEDNYYLFDESSAINFGTDIANYLPTSIFQHVDFYTDLDESIIPSTNRDLGCYINV